MGVGSVKNHKNTRKNEEPILQIPRNLSWLPLLMRDNHSERK